MTLKIKRYPFYVGITTLIVAIVVILTGMFLWISHRESKAAAIQMADRLFSEINEKALERYESASGIGGCPGRVGRAHAGNGHLAGGRRNVPSGLGVDARSPLVLRLSVLALHRL